MKVLKQILAAAMMMCCFSWASATDDWANINRYDANNQTVKNQENTGTRVVFVGNSITDFWASTHPQFFTDNDFIGRGISGQTTYQFLVRFREDVVELSPAAVVINGGTNDIAENNYAYNENRTFGNLASMAEIASSNGIKVIMASVLPAAGFNWNNNITDAADKIASLNARIKAYADSKGYPYIDYYSQLVWGDDHALNPSYTEDGVHPTAAGYDVMEAVALPIIRSVVQLGDNIPEAATLCGEALAEGNNLSLNKRGLGSFELYTRLTADKAFEVVCDGKHYGIADGALYEGKTTSVSKNGVYRIKANFVSRTASVEQVGGLGLFYCIANDRQIELTYTGNGTFKGYGDIALQNQGWGYDNRYRIAMDLDSKTQWWGPINDNEDGDPSNNAAYFYMKETFPADQWSNKWKFDTGKADANHVLKGIEITVNLNASQYNHSMAYGVDKPQQDIPGSLTAGGEGLAEGSSFKMTKIGDDTFELFTTLKAGKEFVVYSDKAAFSSNKGELQTGGSNSVDKDGIYCININFTKGTFDIDEVTKMTVYCCWFGSDLNDGCTYIGNGRWEQTAYWGIDDDRYKFRMDVGGKSQYWGPVNTALDSTPNGSAEYFQMVRSTPADQWSNKWKVASELKGKDVKWTISLNGDQYTHTQEAADPASASLLKADDKAEAEYYTLGGIKVEGQPSAGIYLRRTASGATEKVIIK